MLARLEAELGDQIRVAYRHLPLDIHDKAQMAVRAAEAAGWQSRFWEMHDLLFERQSEWSSLSEDDFREWLIQAAEELELDADKFAEDLDSDELIELAQQAWEKNAANGLTSTPFLVVNGRPYGGPTDYGRISAVIRAMLLEPRQYSECPPQVIDPEKAYFAILQTEKGDITIELFADQAPVAVNSFVFLARQDWFDGVTFHRVLPGFVAQAGDPSGTGMGGPGYMFDNEVSQNLTFDGAGVVGMANAGPGTNGSQFFITYTATPQLNGGYTVFGRVIEGMDVVESLTPRDPSTNMDLPLGDEILDVVIEEK